MATDGMARAERGAVCRAVRPLWIAGPTARPPITVMEAERKVKVKAVR